MHVVTSTSPEVSDLLRLDVAVGIVRRAVKRRRWKLQDGKRWCVASKRLRHSRNGGNERRQRESRGRNGQKSRKGGKSETVHDLRLDLAFPRESCAEKSSMLVGCCKSSRCRRFYTATSLSVKTVLQIVIVYRTIPVNNGEYLPST